MPEHPSLFSSFRKRFRRQPEIEFLVEWMNETGVKIGCLNLVTQDGEPLVVLIGRGNRAADLQAAYDALNVEPVIQAKFDPPMRLSR